MKVAFLYVLLLQLVCGIFSQFTFDRSLYNDSIEVKELLKDILRKLDVRNDVGTTYKDCSEIKAKKPSSRDGIYEITTHYSRRTMKVFCDMTSDDGKGWTVIQRREDGSENFTRNWFQYKYGFGDLNGEFWLGNDNIYHLTNQDLYRAKFEISNFNSEYKYATYSTFFLGDERSKYRLDIGGYIDDPSADAGDAMSAMHHGKKFSTWDQDNDLAASSSCVTHPHYNHGGGWWFGNCDTANINGAYLADHDHSRGQESNIEWGTFHGSVHWIKRTVLKLRPVADFD